MTTPTFWVTCANCKSWQDERIELRAENERLKLRERIESDAAVKAAEAAEQYRAENEAARAALKGADAAGMALFKENERLRETAVTGVRLHRDTQPFDGTPLNYVVVSILFEGEWREIIRALADTDFDDATYSWQT
jgi:septal ring factor EnvC (AmiA/AmiB activator)